MSNEQSNLQELIVENSSLRAQLAEAKIREHELTHLDTPLSVLCTIDDLLADAMNVCVQNGANSISMPDQYVELAGWLAGINPTSNESTDSAKYEREIENAFTMLELYGVPRERARTLSNGIDVLATRFRKAEIASAMTITNLEEAVRQQKERNSIIKSNMQIVLEEYEESINELTRLLTIQERCQ